MTNAALALEVDLNFDYFQRHLAQFMRDHAGQFALIKGKSVVDFFNSPGDAYRHAQAQFADGLFSIQEVIDEPIDLGFFSHVGH